MRAGDQPTLGPLQRKSRGSLAPRGSSTQWATAGASEAPCGKEWWARKGKEPLTKTGMGRTKDDGTATL